MALVFLPQVTAHKCPVLSRGKPGEMCWRRHSFGRQPAWKRSKARENLEKAKR